MKTSGDHITPMKNVSRTVLLLEMRRVSSVYIPLVAFTIPFYILPFVLALTPIMTSSWQKLKFAERAKIRSKAVHVEHNETYSKYFFNLEKNMERIK